MDILSYVMGMNAAKGSGGSSGGGGLPAGLYWEAILKPYYRGCRFFEFNGETYVLIQTNTSDVYEIYKYADGILSLVTTCAANTGIVGYGVIIEYDGEVHFIGNGNSYGKTHTVWNGTTFTSKKAPPNYNESINNTGAVVFNGELYACLGGNKLYKWNKSEDTWSFIANTNDHHNLMVINNSLYQIKYSNLYLFNNDAFELVLDFNSLDSTIGQYTDNYSFTKDNHIIFRNSSTYKMYEYSLDNQTLNFLGYAPSMSGSTSKDFVVNGQYYMSDAQKCAMRMQEAT